MSRWHLQGYLGAISGYLGAIRRQDGPKTALERPCWSYIGVKVASSGQVNMNAHHLSDEGDAKHVAKAEMYKKPNNGISSASHRYLHRYVINISSVAQRYRYTIGIGISPIS